LEVSIFKRRGEIVSKPMILIADFCDGAKKPAGRGATPNRAAAIG
jgi:hypothetical protein